MSYFKCQNCGQEFSVDQLRNDIYLCISCGSQKLDIVEKINDSVIIYEDIKYQIKDDKLPSRYKTRLNVKDGMDYNRNRNKFVYRKQILDRENGQYSKFVKDIENGDIIRDESHLLTEHRGRGNAKKDKET